MSRHVLTQEDGNKARRESARVRREKRDGVSLRRQAELYLLNKLLAELVMPEMYPHG